MTEQPSAQNVSTQIVNAAIVRPGDTLIIAFDRLPGDHECDQLRAEIRARLDIEIAVIAPSTGLAVYRPGPVHGEEPPS